MKFRDCTWPMKKSLSYDYYVFETENLNTIEIIE